MYKDIGHFLDGVSVPGKAQRYGAVYNPSTGEQIARCDYGDVETVDRAVKIAREAGAAWGSASQATRLQVIFKFRQLLIDNTPALAEAIGKEHGKTIADAKGEIGRAIEAIEFATNAPQVTKGEYSRNVGGGIDVFSVRVPVGVVGCITPFNFPVMVPVMMITMAIACGNAIVLKPSEKVPSATLLLSELWTQAGLPKGVLNVVNGDKEVVDGIIQHPGIAAICFVGSTKIGEYVYQQGCAHNKRVGAYTGAKNHMIVMPDADLEAAATAFVSSGYGSASQRCMALSLLVAVGEGTGEKLRKLLIPKIQALTVGSYDDPKADFGAVISAESKESIEKAIDDCLAAGAELLVDGRGLAVPGHPNGFYVGPTLLGGVTTDMAFYKEEVFGPARGMMEVKDLDEAIALANGHEFGNGAVIYTRDGLSASRFVEQVDAGAIGVNVPVPVPVGYHNFGGLRRSKFGDAHLFGPDAARFYTKGKTVSQRWPEYSKPSQDASLAFPENS